MKKRLLFVLFSITLFCAGSFAQNTIDIRTALSDTPPGRSQARADVYSYRGAKTGVKPAGYAWRNGTEAGIINNSKDAAKAWTSKRTNAGLEIIMTAPTGIYNTGFRFQNALKPLPLGASDAGVMMRIYYACSEKTVWRGVFNVSISGTDAPVDSSRMNIVLPPTDAEGGSVLVDLRDMFNGDTGDACNVLTNIRLIIQNPGQVPAGTKFIIKRILIGAGAKDGLPEAASINH
ncbi:MAG: hypothetical protein LBK22_08545 [Tannerella sp.]|jgi:hypothetical protein|nr:hypothetical protein [Tannerella sp.]